MNAAPPHSRTYEWRGASRPQEPPLFISAATLAGRPKAQRGWIFHELIPDRQVSSIDGDGGTGKSSLALHASVCVAVGRSFLGLATARGPVMYLASEDDLDELHRRLDDICLHEGIGLEDLEHLHLGALADGDPALVAEDRNGLVTLPMWDDLEAAIERIKPVLVVLDSRADVYGANESTRAHVVGFVRKLRKLAIRHRLAVVLLAHPSLAGLTSGNGNSGSTHWRNAVRSALYLEKVEPEGEGRSDPNLRRLTVKKANYSAGGQSLLLRWSLGAMTLAAEDGVQAPAGAAEQRAAVDELFLRLLARYVESGRTVSDSTGHNYAPKLFAGETAAVALGIKPRAFAAAMNRLFEAGSIAVATYGPPSRLRRRLEIVARESAS